MIKKFKIALGALCLSGLFLFSAPIDVNAAEDVVINESNFPDSAFRSVISKKVDKNKDGKLSQKEIQAVKELDVSNKATNMKGIEYFTELEVLYVDRANLTSLDLSKNTKLKGVDCRFNPKLSSLILGKNKNLEGIDCRGCNLTTLDLTGCPNIDGVFCFSNNLTSLDLSKNPKLQWLRCEGNKLTSLNLSKNPKMEFLWCDGNKITNLDVSNCKVLCAAVAAGQKNEGEFIVYKYNQINTLITDVNTKVNIGKNKWVQNDGKWYYISSNGAPAKGWKKVWKSWYYFKADGTMASYEYINGYWLAKSGAWTYQYRASWKKGKKGWWYGDTSGWYAKNTTLTIDGKKYTFDNKGYLK